MFYPIGFDFYRFQTDKVGWFQQVDSFFGLCLILKGFLETKLIMIATKCVEVPST